MKTFQIKEKYTQDILYTSNANTFKDCLERAIAENVNLNGADLSFQNLGLINLDNAQLSGASFSHSNLSNANLSEACFKGSDFSNTNMTGACMAESDFSGASFLYTDFGANILSHSVLDGAHFNTLSGFQLPFIETQSMRSCSFFDDKTHLFTTSKPPIVILGICNTPLIIAENAIYSGHCKLIDCNISNWIMLCEQQLRFRKKIDTSLQNTIPKH